MFIFIEGRKRGETEFEKEVERKRNKLPVVLHIINRPALIRHQCRETTVLSCHRCLISSGVKN
jgi:hypothetical protein